jgi:hypothetical protein
MGNPVCISMEDGSMGVFAGMGRDLRLIAWPPGSRLLAETYATR